MNPVEAIPTVLARATVTALFSLTQEGLCAIARTDSAAHEDLAGLPDGFIFEMAVLPSGPRLRVRKQRDRFVPDRGSSRPTLSIQFKHLRHALRVIAMIDDVPKAIANDRLVIDGELSWAMRIGRITERMMSALVPRALSAAPGTVRLYAEMVSAERVA